ncbi:MOSC domain-containing protein [Ancylobacter oerskovii]|uniref:MOSC domain-containing protein n=1 Tax=Ancylobacter oerskovii TaxID=459519 RepID=A0ABW4YYN3_9HYPH|nr:MOSC domain-containing protein [Ancylobacter oerskovii]MBS7541706.1 MOSC domain-containing protein [Ancylobacter oerskovii]
MNETLKLFDDGSVPARKVAARLSQLMIADGADFITRPVERATLDFEGLAGDRHRGLYRPADSRVPWYPRGTPIRNARQVTLVAPDELALIARRLEVPAVEPAWLGANLVLEGVADLTALPPGTRLHFPGGACLAVEGENAPCRHAGAAVARHHPGRTGLDLAFVTAARGRRGLVAWVERPGELVAGSPVELRVPAQKLWGR